MKITRPSLTLLKTALFAGALSPGLLLADDASLANIQPGGITWSVPDSYAEAELFVGGNAGSVSLRFQDGESISFTGQGEDGSPLPDDYYSYSLSLVPQAVADDKAALEAAREAGDEAEVERLSNRLQEAADYDYHQESGEFQIISGLIEIYDVELEQAEAQAAEEAAEAQAAQVAEEA